MSLYKFSPHLPFQYNVIDTTAATSTGFFWRPVFQILLITNYCTRFVTTVPITVLSTIRYFCTLFTRHVHPWNLFTAIIFPRLHTSIECPSVADITLCALRLTAATMVSPYYCSIARCRSTTLSYHRALDSSSERFGKRQLSCRRARS